MVSSSHALADVTGSPTSKRAIIDIYDVFGLAPQTLQGADRLARSLNGLVLIPDFFRGSPADPGWFPKDTPEKEEAVQKFMKEKAMNPENVPMVLKVTAEAKKRWPAVESWGAFGLCWGGKVRTYSATGAV